MLPLAVFDNPSAGGSPGRRRAGCLRYVAQHSPPARRPSLRVGTNAFLVATAVFSLLAWRGVLFPAERSPLVRHERVLGAAGETHVVLQRVPVATSTRRRAAATRVSTI